MSRLFRNQNKRKKTARIVVLGLWTGKQVVSRLGFAERSWLDGKLDLESSCCFVCAPWFEEPSGDNVTASLGGGWVDGRTDPSACSDLKGHEVGTRSAEPPRHPHSHLRGQALKSRNRTWGAIPRRSDSISKIGGRTYLLVLG